MQSIFWHDYETFGANPQKDRPSQFAGVRTDLDLNLIDEPVTFFCCPPEDTLPDPIACLITGITPQHAAKEGVSEAQFANEIQNIFSVPGTCVAGYNSIRFDDEVSRNLFYRNFIDPYEREWKNGNSRWDIIDVVRLTYVLKPEGIHWPLDEAGLPSFRLEKLTEANGIEHLAAHDAMSDVYATIDMARLIKSKQPQLYNYVFAHRDKHKLFDLIDIDLMKPLLHVSSKYPRTLGCCALVAPLFIHPVNKNGVVVFDLRQDPRSLAELTVQEIRERLYTRQDELPEGTERPALKTVHVNKCPMLVPASMAKTIPEERRRAWCLDMEQAAQHLNELRVMPELVAKLRSVFNEEQDDRSRTNDPDLMIYSGGFFSPNDRQQMQRVRSASQVELAEEDFVFSDQRLPEMLFRYKARNFPATLSDDEQERWVQHCTDRLLGENSEYLTINHFFARLETLAIEHQGDPAKLSILEDLKYFAESIIPYY